MNAVEVIVTVAFLAILLLSAILAVLTAQVSIRRGRSERDRLFHRPSEVSRSSIQLELLRSRINSALGEYEDGHVAMRRVVKEDGAQINLLIDQMHLNKRAPSNYEPAEEKLVEEYLATLKRMSQSGSKSGGMWR